MTLALPPIYPSAWSAVVIACPSETFPLKTSCDTAFLSVSSCPSPDDPKPGIDLEEGAEGSLRRLGSTVLGNECRGASRLGRRACGFVSDG